MTDELLVRGVVKIGEDSEVGPVSLLDRQSRNWQSRLSHGTFEELVSFFFHLSSCRDKVLPLFEFHKRTPAARRRSPLTPNLASTVPAGQVSFHGHPYFGW